MTSTGFELDQLAYGISWPVRALAAVARLVDPWLSNPVARRAVRRWSVAEPKRRNRPWVEAVAPPHRVLSVGAGEHGLSIGRELVKGAAPGVELIGFLDDAPAKIGASLYGVPVLGPAQDALA